MSSFDDFCTDISRFADRAAKKTGELAQSASLRLKLERVKIKGIKAVKSSFYSIVINSE